MDPPHTRSLRTAGAEAHAQQQQSIAALLPFAEWAECPAPCYFASAECKATSRVPRDVLNGSSPSRSARGRPKGKNHRVDPKFAS